MVASKTNGEPRNRPVGTRNQVSRRFDAHGQGHRLAPALRERGHDAVAVPLPAADDSAGWSEYADVIVDAIGYRPEPVLVAQSLGGFSAPLACERKPVEQIVLLNA